eukprot:g26447.t1
MRIASSCLSLSLLPKVLNFEHAIRPFTYHPHFSSNQKQQSDGVQPRFLDSSHPVVSVLIKGLAEATLVHMSPMLHACGVCPRTEVWTLDQRM